MRRASGNHAASTAIRLLSPDLAGLSGYIDALKRGWSPNTTRDVSGEQLALYRKGADILLTELTRQGGTIVGAGGRIMPRLPSRVFWINDGEFCGAINLRFVPGSEGLPPYVSGHVGYSVVRWKQRRGYATRALALILPVAREVGLARVLLTCDDDNDASRKVIAANGGVMDPDQPTEVDGGKTKLRFWIATSR